MWGNVIGLQCYVGFCSTTKRISHTYIYIYLHPPAIPSRWPSRSAELSSVCCQPLPTSCRFRHSGVYTPNSFHESKACTLGRGTPEFHQEAVWEALLCSGEHFRAGTSETWIQIPAPRPGWLSDLRKVFSLQPFSLPL